MTPRAGRGAAFADLDNDGDTDIVVNNMHDRPDLYRLDSTNSRHWLTVKLVGVRSNRSAIGARVRVTAGGSAQVREVRGGGSYYSQNDLRVHFGLGDATSDRAARGSMAERARGTMGRAGRRSDPDAQRGERRRASPGRDHERIRDSSRVASGAWLHAVFIAAVPGPAARRAGERDPRDDDASPRRGADRSGAGAGRHRQAEGLR